MILAGDKYHRVRGSLSKPVLHIERVKATGSGGRRSAEQLVEQLSWREKHGPSAIQSIHFNSPE